MDVTLCQRCLDDWPFRCYQRVIASLGFTNIPDDQAAQELAFLTIACRRGFIDFTRRE